MLHVIEPYIQESVRGKRRVRGKSCICTLSCDCTLYPVHTLYSYPIRILYPSTLDVMDITGYHYPLARLGQGRGGHVLEIPPSEHAWRGKVNPFIRLELLSPT